MTRHTIVCKGEDVKTLMGFVWTDTECIQESHSTKFGIDRHSSHDLNADLRREVYNVSQVDPWLKTLRRASSKES
jgi:hypothetical protein